MKLLRNEFEYRTWMQEVFLRNDDEFFPIFTPDEVERELVRLMPVEFPCVGCIVQSDNPVAPSEVKFLSRDQIAKWSAEMGITKT